MVTSKLAPGPRIVPLDLLSDEPTGGKAEGLARLMQIGLRVPPGFVILDATPDSLPDSLESAYRELGGVPVSVRSSALGEDSADLSYAGQYLTVLDIQGLGALRTAVQRCLDSAHSPRAQAYRQNMGDSQEVGMAVVVQQMVSPRAAGVLFTADPMQEQSEHVVVEAVEGIGEALVSGQVTPDHYVLSRSGQVVEQELQGTIALLSEAELGQLASDALQAEDAFGYPLDMEWAIGTGGDLHWLQARPITALSEPDLFELDSEVPSPDYVYTTCNIGEILPGVITPLTWSAFGSALETAFRDLYSAAGAYPEEEAHIPYINLFGGHLFLSLTKMYLIIPNAILSSKHDMDLLITGRELPDTDSGAPAPQLRRIWNGLNYVRYVFGAGKRVEALDQQLKTFRLPPAATAAEQLAMIRENLPHYGQAWSTHNASSGVAGSLHGTLVRILSGGVTPTAEHHAEGATLMADVQDVESADIVFDLDRITARIVADDAGAQDFVALSPEAALDWLRSPESGEVGVLFEKYLVKHGHRGYREAELRQRDWRDEPLMLVEHLQTTVATYQARPDHVSREETAAETERILSRLNGSTRRVVAFLAPRTRNGIRQRERSKSLCIKMGSVFKRAFRHLGQLLVDEGRLPDVDAVFFLTLDELAQLVEEPHPALVQVALRRRRNLPQQMRLQYPDVCFGRPRPHRHAPADIVLDDGLSGTPVSRGIAIGPARVALTLEDAAELQPGEILIVPYSDVGWTPHFSLAGGLATDIGAPFTHGAVVAREHGLPAVMNLRSATRAFKTGDQVVLNGNDGTLKRVKPEGIEVADDTGA